MHEVNTRNHITCGLCYCFVQIAFLFLRFSPSSESFIINWLYLHVIYVGGIYTSILVVLIFLLTKIFYWVFFSI